MTNKPVICSLDLGTSTGVALGFANEIKPKLMTWNLREAGKGRPVRFLFLFHQLERLFAENRIDVLAVEQPMEIAVAYRVGATEEVIQFLRGAFGVVELQAARAGIEDIRAFDVNDARRHLLGRGRIPKGEGKQYVMKALGTLGIRAQNNNESDAACGFLYVSALVNPRLAHLSSPLFIES